MSNVVWGGIPKMRAHKQEKFTNPVLILAAIEKGTGRKMTFNKAAQEALDIKGEDSINLGFDNDTKQIFVTKVGEGMGYKLTKTCAFSKKVPFEYIAKSLNLDTTKENVFNLVSVPGEVGVFEAVQSTSDSSSEVKVGVTALDASEDSAPESDAVTQPAPEGISETVLEVPSVPQSDSTESEW